MRIDLHTHSNASDGTETPAELIAAAAAEEVDVLALTDHDTTAGWAPAAAALPSGMRLVPGAEFSCESETGRGGHCTVHLLGYLFDPAADSVVNEQRRLRAERRVRVHRMASRMRDDGLPVDPDALLEGLADDVPAGRPHLARALMDAGVVTSVDEAFRFFLASGGRYHVHKNDTPVRDAIAMVRAAGGVTVLAHAFAASRGPIINSAVITELAAAGLDGLEVDHPDHDATTRDELRRLAKDLDLLPTGSSDYHGDNKVNRLAQDTTDPQVFDELMRRASGSPVITG